MSKESQKLHSKLYRLTRKHDVVQHGDKKTSVVEGLKFTCNGRKFNLTLLAESKCDVKTDFRPIVPKITVLDNFTRTAYVGVKHISEFLGLSAVEVEVLFRKMCSDVMFTEIEIKDCINRQKCVDIIKNRHERTL